MFIFVFSDVFWKMKLDVHRISKRNMSENKQVSSLIINLFNNIYLNTSTDRTTNKIVTVSLYLSLSI